MTSASGGRPRSRCCACTRTVHHPTSCCERDPGCSAPGLSADGRRAVLYGPGTIRLVSVNSDVDQADIRDRRTPRMARLDDSGRIVALMTDGSIARWTCGTEGWQRVTVFPPVADGNFGALSALGRVAVVRTGGERMVCRDLSGGRERE